MISIILAHTAVVGSSRFYLTSDDLMSASFDASISPSFTFPVPEKDHWQIA